MATLTTQNISRLGVATSYSAAAGGGDSFTPTRETFLHVKNAGGGSITVTVAVPTGLGRQIPDLVPAMAAVSVPNGSERMIGGFPSEFFADPADGLADITYSGVTSVTIGVFRVVVP